MPKNGNSTEFFVPQIKEFKKVEDHISESLERIKTGLLSVYKQKLEKLETFSKNIRGCNLNTDKTKIILLENQLKKGYEKGKIDYILDGFKGYRSSLRAEIKVLKENIKREEELIENKQLAETKINELTEYLSFINESINKLKFNEATINLTNFVSFNYSVDCNYTFKANETEQAAYTDYETRTRQVPYTKYIAKSRTVYNPRSSTGYSSETYSEPVTAYQDEEYTVPVTKYRKVITKQDQFQKNLDTSSLSNSTRYFSTSSLFDDWEATINNISFEAEDYQITIKEFRKKIGSDFLKIKNNKISVNQIENDFSTSKLFDDLVTSELDNLCSEKIQNLAEKDVSLFITNSNWDEYEDLSIEAVINNDSKNNLCIPFILLEFGSFIEKFDKNILIHSNNMIIENNEYIDNASEIYEDLWTDIDEKQKETDELLKETKRLSIPLRKPMNLRPLLVSLTIVVSFVAIGVTSFNLYKGIRCENEIKASKLTDFCLEK